MYDVRRSQGEKINTVSGDRRTSESWGERGMKRGKGRCGKQDVKKYGSDKWCPGGALLFPSAGVVLSPDNPSQTAVGDRDQIEMTDWSTAQTL